MRSSLKQLCGSFRLGCLPEIAVFRGKSRMLKMTDLVRMPKSASRAESC